MATRNWLRWTVLVGLLALGGCGGSSLGKVSGTVTYKGKPIPEGTILFMVPGTRDATGQIQDGRITEVTCFKTNDGVPLGTARIAVFAFATPATSAGAGYMGMDRKSLIPEKYRDPATSGLTFDVQPGMNRLTIDLTD